MPTLTLLKSTVDGLITSTSAVVEEVFAPPQPAKAMPKGNVAASSNTDDRVMRPSRFGEEGVCGRSAENLLLENEELNLHIDNHLTDQSGLPCKRNLNPANRDGKRMHVSCAGLSTSRIDPFGG